MTMTSKVIVEHLGPVIQVTINRPEHRNALDAEVAAIVATAMDELDSSPELRVGILTGTGGTFSSGMDLRAFLAGESPAIPGRGLCGITEAPPKKPLIAAVTGWALAGGFELVLACDLVIADVTAMFGVPEVQRGLVATGGGALTLARRVPPAVALEMLLTGDAIDAARAAEIGLVNAVVEPGRALEEARNFAARIARNAPLAVVATKQVTKLGGDHWAAQRSIVDPVLSSFDAREGAAAFAQRREPVWQGR